jgi:hypothetical protein
MKNSKSVKKPHHSSKNDTAKEKHSKKERKLDKTIEDTFPASDATAKY